MLLKEKINKNPIKILFIFLLSIAAYFFRLSYSATIIECLTSLFSGRGFLRSAGKALLCVA
jgi:hypothetical protein